MKQYLIEDNKLILKVKKVPLFILIIMYLISFLLFVLPLIGIIVALVNNNGFHIKYILTMFIFGLMSFYIFRISLWNTYGKEELIFNKEHITYSVDYGWFKDKLSTKVINNPSFSIKTIGYEEDKKGVLIIQDDNDKIECVTKMSIDAIEQLIKELIKISEYND